MKKMPMNWSNMAGTEQTGEYLVFAGSNRGRVGVRKFPNVGQVRIRLEPAVNLSPSVMKKWKKELPVSAGFKQPGWDGENRFSVVVDEGEYADAVLESIYGLLGKGTLKGFAFNPELPDPPSTANEAIAA